MSSTPQSSDLAFEVAAGRSASEFLLRLCHDLRSCHRSIQPHAESLSRIGEPRPGDDFNQRLGFLLDGTRRLDMILSGLSAYAVALQLDAGSFRSTSLESALRN